MMGMSAEYLRSTGEGLNTDLETPTGLGKPQPPKEAGPRSIAVSLLRLAETLRRGEVEASFLVASKDISGFQVIRNPETADAFELKQELAALRERLEDALITGDVPASPAIDEARRALASAADQLVTHRPDANHLVLRLAWAADRILQAASVAKDKRDLGDILAMLAVATVALWSVARRLFGVGG